MKLKIILLAFLALSIHAYSQTKNTLSLMYGVGSTDVNIHGAIGDFGYHTQSAYTFGVEYTRGINKYFSIETGLNFGSSNTKETSFPSGLINTYYNSVKMVSIPLLAKFGFFKYLYADIGLSVDIQTNYNGSIGQPPKQSGLGIEGGIGGKYTIGSFVLFVNPYLQNHGIINFSKDSNFNLQNAGVKFGVGYDL